MTLREALTPGADRATLLRLVDDPSPDVAAAAAVALVEATEDADLAQLRPQLAGAITALTQLAATDGDAARAVLRLEGGRAAVPWLVALADDRPAPVSIEALCATIARAPAPEALAPLEALLKREPLLAQRIRLAPSAASADRVRGLTQAIAAIDRDRAVQLVAHAPTEAQPFLEAGIVDDAVHRLVTAPPGAALPRDLGALLPAIEARCQAGDARAIPAALRLGGEPLVTRWIAAIADGGAAPAPLDTLAYEAARHAYHEAAAPLARLIEDASHKTHDSAAWASLLGHDAAAAYRALRVLDPARANMLMAAAPAPLRARLEAQ